MPPSTSSFRNNRSQAGFTILELIVTMSLAVLLAAIAVPSFLQSIANNRLTTQANDLVAAINFARSEAITRNVNISFCRVDTVNDDDCAAGAGWEFWVVRTAVGNVIRRGTVVTAGGIGVTSDLSDDEIVFGSDGLSRTGGVLVSDSEINVCSDSAEGSNIRQITVGAGSRISTERLAGAC